MCVWILLRSPTRMVPPSITVASMPMCCPEKSARSGWAASSRNGPEGDGEAGREDETLPERMEKCRDEVGDQRLRNLVTGLNEDVGARPPRLEANRAAGRVRAAIWSNGWPTGSRCPSLHAMR